MGTTALDQLQAGLGEVVVADVEQLHEVNVPEITWIYLNLPELTQSYLNLPEFTWIYPNLPEFT